MNAPAGLDRKARTAVFALALVVLAIVGMAVRGCVHSITPQSIASASAPGTNQVVQIGDQTIFLEQGSVASRINQWLNNGAADARAFAIDDQAFAPGTDELTEEGNIRLQRFAELVTANRLNAKVYVTTYEGSDTAAKQKLAGKRAERIRSEMIVRGVPQPRIDTAVENIAVGKSSNGPPTIVLVLSKASA